VDGAGCVNPESFGLCGYLACVPQRIGRFSTTSLHAIVREFFALEQQLAAANARVAQLEAQLKIQPAPISTPPDPKATEALAALVELAKALTLVAA